MHGQDRRVGPGIGRAVDRMHRIPRRDRADRVADSSRRPGRQPGSTAAPRTPGHRHHRRRTRHRSAAGRSPAGSPPSSAGAVLLVLAVVYLVDLLSTSGEIERNTTIAGVEVGGMTPEQATAALTAQAVPGVRQPMTVDVHGEPDALDPAAAGSDARRRRQPSQAAGTRSANPFVRLTSFFSSHRTAAVRAGRRRRAERVPGGVAAQTDLAPVEGEVAIDGVTGPHGAAGDRPQPAGAGGVDAVAAAWASGGPTALNGLVLPVDRRHRSGRPRSRSQAAAAEASTILSAPLKLTGAGCGDRGPGGRHRRRDHGRPGRRRRVHRRRRRRRHCERRSPTPSMPPRPHRPTPRISIVDDAPVISPSAPGPHGGLAGNRCRDRAGAAGAAARGRDRLRPGRARADHREGAGARDQGGHRRVHHRRLRRRVRREHQGRRREGQRRDRAAGRDLRAERVHRHPGHRSRATCRPRSSRRVRCRPRSAAASASSPPRCTTPRTSPGWATSPTPRTRSTSAATRRAGRRPSSTARSSWRSPTTTRPAC